MDLCDLAIHHPAEEAAAGSRLKDLNTFARMNIEAVEISGSTVAALLNHGVVAINLLQFQLAALNHHSFG